MRDFSRYLFRDQTRAPAGERLLTQASLRRWLRLLRVLVPAGMALLVIVYQIGPARWLHEELGASYHFVAEIVFYGTVGPALAFLLLDFLGRWLDEKETSELQARALAQAREHARLSRELSDDALQTLFAASTLLASLKSAAPNLPAETAAALLETERSLDRAIQQLRDNLQNPSPAKLIVDQQPAP